MRWLLLVLAFGQSPTDGGLDAQALTCPEAADDCELELEGTLLSSHRNTLFKWDDLRISTVVNGEPVTIAALINIPNRKRLKLKAGVRYRFKVAASKPFGAHDVRVFEAKRL